MQKVSEIAQIDLNSDLRWMGEAFSLAQEAARRGEIPVGAVVVFEGQVIGRGSNSKEGDRNPLRHAELIAIEEASRVRGAWRLSGCTLYVTLEPCGMCAGALVQSRIDRLVYATRDPKTGAVHSLYQMCSDERLNHQIVVDEGVMADDCSALLKNFFAQLRINRTNPRLASTTTSDSP